MHIHTLSGCAPAPLAHYLKALGILRLVAEQKDPAARGWWQDETFHLATKLSHDELEAFFFEECAPTPVIAPWNKGSGFVLAANNPGLAKIEATPASLKRFAPYRHGIGQARALVAELQQADNAIRAIKEETKDKTLSKAQKEALKESPEYKARLAEADRRYKAIKEGMTPLCRQRWRGPHQSWMDAAVVINAEGDAKCPALLGSGGNDGKNDFTKQFMSALEAGVTFSENPGSVEAASRLRSSLFASPAQDDFSDIPVGQFLPGRAGGPNSTTGFDSASAVNAWDYIFMIEGSVLFTSGITKRTGSRTQSTAAAPFTLHASACGHASTSAEEDSARGEQWMPLWAKPTSLAELKSLLLEGRVQLRRKGAERPVDFSRAIARLGVARGITAFQRFGYRVRNGLSNFSVPLGRWRVTTQPHPELLDELDAWMNSLQRAARDKFAPGAFADTVSAMEESVMAVCADGTSAERWQALLAAMSAVESQLVTSGKFTAEKRLRPIPKLSAGWLRAANDGSPEFRLAVALALQSANAFGKDGIRRHWLPLDKFGDKFAGSEHDLAKDPGVIGTGLDAERDLISLVSRRLIEGTREAGSKLPLIAPDLAGVNTSDIRLLLSGGMDLAKILALARALMALNRRDPALMDTLKSLRHSTSAAAVPVDPLYALFRLALAPSPIRRGDSEATIRIDPAIYTRLAAGDLAGAGEVAMRRLQAAGFKPVIRHIAGDANLARRLAVALVFPVSTGATAALADTLTKRAPVSA